MKNRHLFLSFIFILVSFSLAAQPFYRTPVKEVRNVIVMIPDGASTGILSASRWYQIYNNPAQTILNIDPYLCGFVSTFGSEALVPDSAPAMSAYMTGMPQQNRSISVYPKSQPGIDIVEVDSTLAYRPLATLLEAAKWQGKATGVVATIDFCHATPAACAAHHYSRYEMDILSAQMVANDLDVVFGGGQKHISDAMRRYMADNGITFIEQDAEAFRNYRGEGALWSLFTPNQMSYDFDRDDSREPSLAEMTAKALELLSRNEKGFFLMVEGSRIDGAGHANEPKASITDFLAFDKAVGVAMEFARQNGETAVVIIPDHGTGGMTINSVGKGLESAYGVISKVRHTAEVLEQIMLKAKPEEIAPLFKQYTEIELTQEEIEQLLGSRNYKESDYTQVANTVSMYSNIARIITGRTPFIFVSGNHTGEDVFLAAYHPSGDLPLGRNTNIEIHAYMADLLGLQQPIFALSDKIFAPHTEVFKGARFSISEGKMPDLTVTNGRRTLRIPAFGSVVYLDGEPRKLNSVVVYIDRNNTFYLPRELGKIF